MSRSVSNNNKHRTDAVSDQRFAFGWIVFAWLVGTIVFELNATGAPPDLDQLINETFQNRTTFTQMCDQREQDFAISNSGIDNMLRIERASKLRPVFNAVIASAEQEIKQREQLAESKRIEAARIQKELAAKEAEKLGKLVKQVVHSFQELMVPVRVAQMGTMPSDKVAPSETTKSDPVVSVDPEVSAKTPVVSSTNKREVSIEGQEDAERDAVQIVRATARAVVVPPIEQALVSESKSATPSIRESNQVSVDQSVQVDPVSTVLPNAAIAETPPVAEPKTSSPKVTHSRIQSEKSLARQYARMQLAGHKTNIRQTTSDSQNSEVVEVSTSTEVAGSIRSSKPAESATQNQIQAPEQRVAARWPLLTSEPDIDSAVSLNVDKADVRGVIEMLARGYQLNILVSPDVNGSVTANVEGLTPEQTLDGITKMCNLNLQREGDLIFVYPAENLPADARELQVFPLNFVSGEAMEPIVQGLLSPVGDAFVTKVDSEDNRRSEESIVVVDIPEVINQVEQFITQTDRAPRQVMIEANILEVQLSDDMQHGVNFGSILRGDLTVGGVGFDSAPTFTAGRPSTANPVFFAQIDGSRVSSLIDILETTTDSKTLASPRVQVINGQDARIQVGEQLGYKVATATQAAVIESVEFLETGIVLTVTPTISVDNRILLKVKPEVSDGKRDPDLGVPEKTTREVDTSVLLDDHQGLVIGGLIREKDETVVRKLPWLGDVRHVGKFFQRREAERSRTEIVVALTCHIAEDCSCVDDETINFERANERLFQGPLLRNHRPWEPRLPDSAGDTDWMDVKELNSYIP